MMDSKVIGLRIKKLRAKKGISAVDFAKAIGCSQSAVSMYEAGDRVPRDEIKVKIAAYFNKSVDYIFFRK